MIDTGDLRKGLTIELDGNLYSIVDWEHNKTGRGGAVVKLKLSDVRAGHIIERSWPAGSKFQRARVERQPAHVPVRRWRHLLLHEQRDPTRPSPSTATASATTPATSRTTRSAAF